MKSEISNELLVSVLQTHFSRLSRMWVFKILTNQPYRKASSRGAYGLDMILFEVFLKSIDLIPQQQILQQHYLYYR